MKSSQKNETDREPISDGETVYIEESDAVNVDNTTMSTEAPTEYINKLLYTVCAVSVYSDCTTENQIGTIGANEDVICVSEIDNTWIKIEYDGEEAYVLLEYLTDTLEQKTEEIESDPEPTYFEDEYGNMYLAVNEEVRATGNVHVRTGPSMRFKKLGILMKSATVIRIGIGEDGWSKVLYNGEEGYIASCYLIITRAAKYQEVNETVYTIKKTNVRNGPTIEYIKIGELKEGTPITRIGIGDNGWSKVIYNGEEAYIYSLYLVQDDSTSQ
jgi:uncharacterized protein YgiM (DUF1202 family)